MLRKAAAVGDNSMASVLRSALSAGERKSFGRGTELYCELADAIRLERQVNMSAKRARLREEQEGVVDIYNAKRLYVEEQRRIQEIKRQAISDASCAVNARKEEEIAAAATRKYV